MRPGLILTAVAACQGVTGGAISRSAFVSTPLVGRSRLAVGIRGQASTSSYPIIIEERRRRPSLLLPIVSSRCRRGEDSHHIHSSSEVAVEDQERWRGLKESRHHHNDNRAKLRAVLSALPLVVLAVLLVNGQASSAWAAAKEVVIATEPTERVNKVRELLRPIKSSAPVSTNASPARFNEYDRAINSFFQKTADFLINGPLGQAIYAGWNEPVYRFARPPAPGSFAGNVFAAFRSRLPYWPPIAIVALLSFLPIFEARVGVPIGLALGVPWLQALVVGCLANIAAIPVASGLGAFFRDLQNAEPVVEAAVFSRQRYVELQRESNALLGRLSLKKSQLEKEERSLRIAIDSAILALKRGDVMVDAATRQNLMEDITEAAKILLFLGKSEAEQFQKRLEEQLYQTSVGSVLEGGDGAFEEVTVAELGQRRAEIAWHPDLTLFPIVGQAVVSYHMDEVSAQSAYDFQIRPRELQLLRNEVKDLEKEAEARVAPLREAAQKEALKARDIVKVAKEVVEGVVEDDEETKLARRRAAAAAAQAPTNTGPPPIEKTIAEREREEEAKIAELQMKGRMVKNYGWPKAITYVGLPLPFSGAWTAMFWSSMFGAKFGPSAAGTVIGIGISSIIGLALWLSGYVGLGFYGAFLAVLYSEKNPFVESTSEIKDTLQWMFGGGKKKKQ